MRRRPKELDLAWQDDDGAAQYAVAESSARGESVQSRAAIGGCLGALIQIDGCDHRWCEERAPACTLLVYVDDATTRLTMLHFTQTESTFGYFEATRAYIEWHGKSGAFHSDKAAVFRNVKSGKTGTDRSTRSAVDVARDQKRYPTERNVTIGLTRNLLVLVTVPTDDRVVSVARVDTHEYATDALIDQRESML